MKTVYFVRHGESQANVDDVLAGAELDTPLTSKGLNQAKETGQELKNKGIELIVSSPLSRTLDTAGIIANQIGYDPTKIIKSNFFIERSVGAYAGGPNDPYFKDAEADTLHESAETVEHMHKRVKEGLGWLKGLDAQRILIVSHGGVSRILRLIHQDLPHSHMHKLDSQINASVYEFEL